MYKMEIEDIESLYDCVCDIYLKRHFLDDEGLLTKEEKYLALEGIKCRISYRNGTRKLLTAKQTEAEAEVSQSVKLFLSNEFDIPPGSTVKVFKDGEEFDFRHSGRAAKYSSHQEIILEVSKEA